MHGIIFAELERFASEKIGPGSWERLLSEAELSARHYAPNDFYPDAEILALVAAAERLTRIPSADLLESFGEFLVPTYLKHYGHLLRPEWGALDVIEHCEETIHTVVRLEHRGAQPPQLRCLRVRPDEILLLYASARRICPVAVGIATGVGRHFGSDLEIHQRRCMLRGDSECEISIAAS